MRPRVDIPNEQLRRMIEQTLIPPTNVTELDPTSIHTATSRLGDVRGSASERYQLDSMLTPGQLRRTPDSELAGQIRQYYFSTTVEGYDSLLASGGRWVRRHSPGYVRAALEPFWSEPGPVSALFSADVLVLSDGRLWRQVAGRDGCLFEQNLTASQQQLLEKHLGTAAASGDEAAAQHVDESDQVLVIAVVGAFARSAFVYGNRAYRAVGMSAGMAIGAILSAAGRKDARPRVVDRFVDHEVNALLGCDGVDRGAFALLELRWPASQRLAAEPAKECRR